MENARKRSSNAPSILVFDSGVGGLSITQALIKKLPNVNIQYAADNLHFPYGVKTEQALVDRIDHILHRFQEHACADLIVVACNTASTIVLERVRERFSLPIVGVVPAIKPAAKLSETKTIGLLATPGTVTRQYTDDLIAQFASGCTVIRCGSSQLVEFAESSLMSADNNQTGVINQENHRQLVVELSVLIEASEKDMDTVVLACTHFPLVKAQLQQLMPKVKYWVDSGDAIANRVEYLLTHQLGLTLEHNSAHGPQYSSLFSKSVDDNPGLIHYLSQWFSNEWHLV